MNINIKNYKKIGLFLSDSAITNCELIVFKIITTSAPKPKCQKSDSKKEDKEGQKPGRGGKVSYCCIS